MQTEDDARRKLTSTIWEQLPESKLELIGGRLIAGNSLAGSWQLLWAIMQGLGPRAALSFAPPELWREALAAAFQALPALAWPQGWQSWAAQLAHAPIAPAVGPYFDWRHHRAYSLLLFGLYQALREGEGAPLGRSIQRFVLRLGEDGFMPGRVEEISAHQYAALAREGREITMDGL